MADPNWNNDPNSAVFFPNPAVFGATYGAEQVAKVLEFGDAMIDQMETMDERHTLRENFLWSEIKKDKQQLATLDVLAPGNLDKARDFLSDLASKIASGDFGDLVDELRAASASNEAVNNTQTGILATINAFKAQAEQTLISFGQRITNLENTRLTKDEGNELLRTAMVATRAGMLAGHNAKMAAWDDMIAKTFEPDGFDGEVEMQAWLDAQTA